jgi:N-acetylgalactosamine-6-phosphate deacetylase
VTVLAAARVLGGTVPDDQPAWIEVDGEHVVACGVGRPAGATDFGDAFLAPGYVDVQVNGFGATDFATASTDESVALVDELRTYGVTGCCPTICTAPLDTYDDAITRLEAAAAKAPGIVGVHLEGPFLGGAPGAHDVSLLRPVDLDWLDALLTRFGSFVRIVTLAPEADPGYAATRLLVARGVTVALGHSTATYDEARAGADAGATLVTHLFNGMGPLHHRAPGLPGAALDDPRLTPSLIADFLHVHPTLVRIATTARPDLVLVSDAVAVDGRSVLARDGAAYLTDGTLAGSTLTMERAVRNVVALGVPVARAVAMASTNPARVLGCGDRGHLRAGARADVNVLDPETLAVTPVDVRR